MYLQTILNNKTNNYDIMTASRVKEFFQPVIYQWAGDCLNEFFIAGSSAKGVAIKGKSDVDLFVSIKNSCSDSLRDIYFTLLNKLDMFGRQRGFSVRQQNVSIGIKGLSDSYRKIEVDIVPAKQQAPNSYYHSLYKSKQNTWTQTNVKGHIKHIQESGRQDFIKLIKIWRDCHQLEFPSMNIELSVLHALRGKRLDISLESGFSTVMGYFISDFYIDALIDPFNTANVVSNDMTQYEKQMVIKQAQNFYKANDWSQVIW